MSGREVGTLDRLYSQLLGAEGLSYYFSLICSPVNQHGDFFFFLRKNSRVCNFNKVCSHSLPLPPLSFRKVDNMLCRASV